MVYQAIGLMSGSSMDGLDIVFAEFQQEGSAWSYEIRASACYPYNAEWVERLKNAIHLSAREYQLLHTDYGHYIGQEVSRFIEENNLQYKVGLVSSHGHTTFHMPERRMTGQLGDGASIAAELKLPVVTDLRAMDLAFGGQGAPIVPIGERYLLGDYDFFLNLGGIANISFNDPERYIAFDICAANRILNMLINQIGKEYDAGGELAASGKVNNELLEKLNGLEFYKQPYPKSLANDFGTDIVFPLVQSAGLSLPDAMRTYSEHITIQISNAIHTLGINFKPQTSNLPNGQAGLKLLATGGGAFNAFIVRRLSEELEKTGIQVIVPDPQLVNFKEALVMAFMGILRWRQEYNVLSSVTGASRNSIGGALWTGEEA